MPGSVTISSELRKDSSLATPGGYIPTGERVPVLDGIRGIAILLVMMFHFWAVGTARLSYPLERAYSSIAGMGWIGVDLFFVLSGFLITGILLDLRRNPDYFRIFYGRRTVRIFPLYYAALTVFFLVVPMLLTHLHHQRAFDVETGTAGKLFAWTYLLNWYEGLKGFQIIPHPLQHFWSLAIEEQFYLVWPFLVLKLARRRLIQVCFGLMALGLFMRAVMYWIHLPIAAYTWTICRADPLAAGAIVALAARDPGDWKILSNWARRLALPAFCAIVLLRVFSPNCTDGPGASPDFAMGTIELTLAGILFSSCLALAIQLRREHPASRLLGSSFLRFFGKYSYCLYVCHVPIITFLAKAGLNSNRLLRLTHNEFLAILAINAIGFAASIAVAFASWHLYEKQWLKLKNLPMLHRTEPLMVGGTA
ncbi:MAG: acyltransferase [Terracidiphilus sp.]|jgi:peptidoglycan/LPS O-acetylase OafA/YrhL